MEKLDLFRALGEVDDDILEDAEAFLQAPTKRLALAERHAPAVRHAQAWVKWGGLAACTALAVCAVWFTTRMPVDTIGPRATAEPSAAQSALPSQEVGETTVDAPAVEPAEDPEAPDRPPVEMRFNELAEEPLTAYSMFALMVEDFVPMTRAELLDYYGVTLPVEELFPNLSAAGPEEGDGFGRGIYRRGDVGAYFDTNTFSFTSDGGVQAVDITLDKEFHLPSSPWELPGDELCFTVINGWELALFRWVDEAGDGYFCTEFRQNGVNFRVTGKNLAEGEFSALLEALLEPREDFAPGEVRTVTGTYTGGLSRQTLTSTQLDGSTGGTSTDTFITYSGPLGLLTVHGGNGYSSLRIELTPEQAAQLQFAGLALGDQVTVRFTGEPATIGTVWNQQLVSIEAA